MRSARATARFWLPLLGCALCLLVATATGATVTWILLLVAFGLLMDGTTAMWARAGANGGMSGHRQ